MQVLGDLVYLENETILPLPWWHRAPLGLMHDTSVHLSVVRRRKPRRKPSGGWRLPDLIVSVTDPANWDRMFHVTARTPDEPGRLAEATHFELPINIALAESATVDNGRFHEVTFICEPTSKQRIKKRHLRKHFRQRGFRETVVEDLFARRPRVLCSKTCRVDHGTLRVNWKQLLMKGCHKEDPHLREFAANSQLEWVVVSADTRRRILRYVFPSSMPVTLKVNHPDRPGVMHAILQIINRSELNILSALLRRGGTDQGRAVLVVVCETTRDQDVAHIRREVQERLLDLEGVDAHLLKEKDERRWVIYPRHPEEAVIRVPEALSRHIRILTAASAADPLKKMFVSRRFVPGPYESRKNRILDELDLVLRRGGWSRLEAGRARVADTFVAEEVLANMWVADGGIILVTDMGTDMQSFTENLAHEFGVLQALGKLPALLVEEGQDAAVQRIANLRGLKTMVFAKDEAAFESRRENSIERLVSSYLRELDERAERH